MKKKYWIPRFGMGLIVAGSFLMIGGCSGNAQNSVKDIQSSGVLKVAMTEKEDIASNVQQEGTVGTELELIQMIADALGVKADYQTMSYDAALDAVRSGTADIAIGGIHDSSALSEHYLTSTVYGKGFFYAVTQNGDYAQTTGAFRNSVLGVQSSLHEDSQAQVAGVSGVSLKAYASADDVSKDIRNGVIRAYICYEDQAEILLNDPQLQVQNLNDAEPEEYIIVAGKEDQTLISGINVLIQQFLEKE